MAFSSARQSWSNQISLPTRRAKRRRKKSTDWLAPISQALRRGEVWQHLELFGALRGLPKDAIRERGATHGRTSLRFGGSRPEFPAARSAACAKKEGMLDACKVPALFLEAAPHRDYSGHVGRVFRVQQNLTNFGKFSSTSSKLLATFQ